MSNSISEKPKQKLKGYLIDVQKPEVSGIRENRYQVMTIRVPLFNSKKFFLYDFDDFNIVMFEENEDLRKDFKVGEYLIMQVRGNFRSNDSEIKDNEFIVGESIRSGYLHNDKNKSAIFYKLYIGIKSN